MGKTRLVDEIGQFTTIPNSVIDMWADIGPDAMSIFLYLRFRTNKKSGLAFPSYTTIQKDTGLSRQRISAALKRLNEFDLVEKRKRFGKSTQYILKLPVVQPSNYSSSDVEPSVVQPSNTNQTEDNKIESEPEEPPADKPRTQKQQVTALLVKAFEEASGIKEPEYTTAKQQRAMAVRWWNPMWEIYKTCDKLIGLSESLIGLVVSQMRADGLTIAAPQSILNVAISIHGVNNANTTNGTPPRDDDYSARIDKALGSRRA